MLEGACYFPDDRGIFPAVVLCHPHPLFGGSMNNNVVLAAASELVDASIIAFMFNFRGAGGSSGNFGNGVGEQEDVKAAIGWLDSQPEVDSGNIGLLGYSFGAAVASPVACDDERVKAVALISPPLDESQVSRMGRCVKPKIIICGTEDTVVSPRRAELISREWIEPKQVELVSGADHFWWGYEAAMAEKATAFFSSFLAQAGS